jgi:hypothetical protein
MNKKHRVPSNHQQWPQCGGVLQKCLKAAILVPETSTSAHTSNFLCTDYSVFNSELH